MWRTWKSSALGEFFYRCSIKGIIAEIQINLGVVINVSYTLITLYTFIFHDKLQIKDFGYVPCYNEIIMLCVIANIICILQILMLIRKLQIGLSLALSIYYAYEPCNGKN